MTALVCWFLIISVGVGCPETPPLPACCCCCCWIAEVVVVLPTRFAVWMSCGCWDIVIVPFDRPDGVSVTRLLFILSTAAVC
uniref:Putative secreted protein n=1 Tax=Anopheles marajoara TaxID=58244 RepID=A0A2M4CBE6_9DIPT